MGIQPTPSTPSQMRISSETDVKVATPDLILVDNSSTPIEVMLDLVFEDIGGQEIIDVARHDTVNGQKVSYSPIKRLELLDFQYGPNNIIGTSPNSTSFFLNFPIKLEGSLPSFSEDSSRLVYFDQNQQAIIITLINVDPTERVQVQILSSGTVFDDTIYTNDGYDGYDEYGEQS
jgi:hypothetical protein